MPGINQIGVQGQVPAPRSFFISNVPGQQQSLSTSGGPVIVPLKPAQAQIIPAGNWVMDVGCYTDVQYWDQQSMLWRALSPYTSPKTISSDGTNVKLTNTTGCPIAAVVTTRGAALTAGFYGYNAQLSPVTIIGGATTVGNTYLTCTPSAGGSLFNVFVGGTINTTVTITTAGTNYLFPPVLLSVAPSNQGAQPYIQATASCTISAGAINSVTVTNQGAGYVSPPTWLIINCEGDATGAGAVLTSTNVNSGSVSAVTIADSGTASVTAVPTLAFAGTSGGGGAAATAIMNFSLQSVSAIGSAGAAYGNAQQYITLTSGGATSAVATNTNPSIETQQIQPANPPVLNGTSAAGGTIVSLPAVLFGGYGYQAIPIMAPYPTGAVALSGLTLAVFTAVWGGNSDNSYMYPI